MLSRHLTSIISLMIYSVVAKSSATTTPTSTIAVILPQSTLAMDWGIDWGADVPYWKTQLEAITITVIVPAPSPTSTSVSVAIDLTQVAEELNEQLSILEVLSPSTITTIPPSTSTSASSIPTLVASKMAKVQNRYRSYRNRKARIT